ncbi:glycosyltransferase [Microbacterium sp. cf332]|uniref:glycosyltransferase n=1 Tax=Microbacterium sp. cf332 TaxID=1761804 RepID=UPI0008833F56|nr:glycosyltransferase [Microbacterium sp. cf332]SDQ28711.1 Predicted glycosyl transferase [Microbacterium sp. cf332]
MTDRLGWYVHHHGRGHLTRMLAIAAHLPLDVVCFSSLAEPTGLPANVSWVALPRDDDPQPTLPADDPTAGGLLHWAPLRHEGHRARLAAMAAAVATGRIGAVVVDVSAEVTLFLRLLGVPVVIITQPGDRVDEPHRLAFAAANRVVAPWPDGVYAPAHLTALGDRVVFVGGISRFAGRPRPASRGSDGTVVLLGGGGGSDVSEADIADAERATARPWRTLGAGGAQWSADPWDALTTASVVVSWCGQNAVADLAAAAAPAIVIPQDRPFAEQRATARALGHAGLAVTVDTWPAAERWPGLLDAAAALGDDWGVWRIDGAAERAAEVILAETGAGGRS